ncbi:serine/threonine-protein kinase [Polyangium fumosum]|uniref:Serine/threonine protein kinase n=1 Tax=Polyangium fumosum TaxID=889272 RepID=A0A4U1J814_9BACT|nr:serine/threonine-protein kinase [Polyangium fumosum]TKD03534.1 serine/threonine protein kinase [Polyangium fumosum]
MRLRPGDTVDRYVIEAPLGEGGMGDVYQARDTRLERRVALKLLRKQGTAEPEAWQRAEGRMLREARAAAALSHPNTVAIYDIGELDGAPYLAMEFVDGVSLRQLIAAGTTSSRRLGWLVDVARALSAAHREGIVHRDIKPENVMLRDDGAIKVLDFGIARRMRVGLSTRGSTPGEDDLDPPSNPKSDTLTGEGMMVGTPAYMAPEQLRGDAVDARIDQFGWGVLAYELLTGEVPFGPGLDGVRLLSAILADDPPSLDGIVPATVERTLRRAVSKRPADRFPSMDHVIETLVPFVTGEFLAIPDVVRIVDADAEEGPNAPSATRAGAPAVGHEPETLEAPRPLAASTSRSATPRPEAGSAPMNTIRSPSPVTGKRAKPFEPPSVRIERPAPAPPERPPLANTVESPTAVAVGPTLRASVQGRWQLVAAVTLAITGLAVLSTGIVSRLRRRSAAQPVASASAAPSTTPTAVTELELPSSASPEALAAYRQGLQSIRDASWGLAYDAFERAAKLDPTLGAAHLRLAVIDRFRGKTTSTRAEFQRAVELRATMPARDQVLLDAFEPLIQRDPPDQAATTARLEAATRRFPGDAELVLLLHAVQPDASPEHTLALVDRCLELDQRYADCWQARALALFRDERIPEAIDALDRCVELAPLATDCVIERLRFQKLMGRCSRLEPDARRWITKEQASPFAYQELAVALEASGQPLSAVGAAVDQAVRRFREAGMPEAAVKLRINLAILSGHFDEAERLAKDFDREIIGEPQEEKHAVPALALVRLYWEMGQDRKAGEVAEQFLSQRAAWGRPLMWRPWDDAQALLLKAKQRAGRLDAAAYEAARAGWEREWQGKEADPSVLWLIGTAATASTPQQGRDALAGSVLKRPHLHYPQADVSMVTAVLGEVAFLAGRYDEALPRLESAARSCTALDAPLRHTLATYRLGVVRERLKEKAEACAAYKVVLRRWGQADASTTAKAAAQRATALGCQD